MGKTFSKEEIKEYIAKEHPTPPTPDKRFVPHKSRPVVKGRVKDKAKGIPHPDEGAFLGKHRIKIASDMFDGKTPKGGNPDDEAKSAESLDTYAGGHTGVNALDPPDLFSDEQIDYLRSLKKGLEQDFEAFPGQRASITSRLEYVEDQLAEMLLITFNRFPKHLLSEIEPLFVRAGLSALQRKIAYLTLVGKDQKQIKNRVKKCQSTVTRNKKDAYEKLCRSHVPLGGERRVWYTVIRVLNPNRSRGRRYG